MTVFTPVNQTDPHPMSAMREFFLSYPNPSDLAILRMTYEDVNSRRLENVSLYGDDYTDSQDRAFFPFKFITFKMEMISQRLGSSIPARWYFFLKRAILFLFSSIKNGIQGFGKKWFSGMRYFRLQRSGLSLPALLMTALYLLLASSCSLNKMAMNKVAGMLTSSTGGTVFTGDNDPELVGDALPFAIKLYESLMVSMPWHSGLKLRTGSLYIMYANAFLEAPAKLLSDKEYEKEEVLLQRSKNLYLRGRDIILEALDREYPGFSRKLDERRYSEAAAMAQKEDIDFLYWGGAGWLGAFAIDPFDMDIGLTLPGASALMERVLELDENYGGGSIHEFYITYYASLPDYMGGNVDKAREHFKIAVEMTGGKSTSAYLSFATGICVKEQNSKEFKRLLHKVLEVDPDADPGNRLLTILNQRRARWLLDHIEDYFLEIEERSAADKTKEIRS